MISIKNHKIPIDIVRLNLANCGITEIPAEIGQLKNIETLNLSTNNLTKIPAEIGKLDSLVILDLSNNALTELPPEIGQLKNLKLLDVTGNNLTKIPTEIIELNLFKLYTDSISLKPTRLDVVDATRLRNICQAYIDELDEKGWADDDTTHYIFEAAMEAVFGKDVWIWVNSKLSRKD